MGDYMKCQNKLTMASNKMLLSSDPTVSHHFSNKAQCAIESAAHNNPQATIFVYTRGAYLNVTDMLHTYLNIRLVVLKPELVFEGTPLARLWSKQLRNASYSLLQSEWSHVHLAYAVRLALLYKYGGIYCDMDTITLRSLKSLMKFSGVAQERKGANVLVNNAVLCFKKKHPLLNFVMEAFASRYTNKGIV